MDSRIIKYYAGELNKEERKSLLQEAFSNEELKKEMINCQNLQLLMKLHPQEKNELLGKVSFKQFMQSRQAERHKKTASLFLRYAAIVIICIAFAGWITYATVNNNMPQPIAQVLSVPAGQRVHITLPDGSKVWVNAGSTLSYPSVFGKERRVKITGEAFFEVKGSDHLLFLQEKLM
jgi:transmembrane sensor